VHLKIESTLDIAQSNAREQCISNSEKYLASLETEFSKVFQVTSDTLHGIWNNYELMVTSGEKIHAILSGSELPGVDGREKFESILSAFCLGLTPIKDLIYEGAYVQSSILLRSNIEILVQLKKILNGIYKDKETPNISRLKKELRKIYSELTGLAHLSDSKLLTHFTKGGDISNSALVTPLFRTLTPVFKQEIGEVLFSLHIVTSIDIIILVGEYLNSNIPSKPIPSESINQIKNICLDIWKRHLLEQDEKPIEA
jgi:hypothetical protein